MGEFAPVFAGWNVWSVYQTLNLDFSILMVGLSRDSRLKIWVEDQVRLYAPDTAVADPVDLKGSQVQIVRGRPTLPVLTRKEDVPGTLLVDGPAELRYVRFFNRGKESKLLWPHDDNYLVNEVFRPSVSDPLTSGGGPLTTTQNITKPILQSVVDVAPYALLAGLVWLVIKEK